MKLVFLILYIGLSLAACGPRNGGTLLEDSAFASSAPQAINVALGKIAGPNNPNEFKIFAAPQTTLNATSVKFCFDRQDACKAGSAKSYNAYKLSGQTTEIYTIDPYVVLAHTLLLTVLANDTNGKVIASTVQFFDKALPQNAVPQNTVPQNTTNQASELVKNPENFPITQFEFEVIKLVNIERQNVGLGTLSVQGKIMTTSRESSKLMQNQKGLTHGLTSGWMRENIAMGQQSPASVMNSWMNSDGHKKNILADGIRFIGVGDTSEGSGSIYWTQQFN